MANPRYRLHGIYPYDRSAKARWLLAELGISHEDRWLDRETREFEKPEYLALNPMGRIPVLEIDGQAMFESGAICSYLADRHFDKGLAPALDSPERAIYQQWMYFAASTLDPIQAKIMIIEDIPAGEVQKSKESEIQEELRDAMQALDRTLSRGDYLVGNRFTAADICVSYQALWLTLWPELESVMKLYPRVLAYIERMKSRPAAIQAKVFSYPG